MIAKYDSGGIFVRQPNDAQRRVIDDLDNNIILFASAGTGKTFTVAKRVAQIIQSGRAKPSELLCLTFTVKACEEMREDIAQYVGQSASEVEIRTIHSFCYQMMREENRRKGARYTDVVVCDESDAEALLQSILSSQFRWWESGALTPFPEQETEDEEETQFEIFNKKGGLRNFVSALKHVREEQDFYSGDEVTDYQKAFDFLQKYRAEQCDALTAISTKRGWQVCDESFLTAMKKHAGRLAFAYDDHLRQSNCVDYDDLILFALRAFKDEETHARWAAKYRYITVDEMQDTSLLEYTVLTALFPNSRVMMCGDFFQSIYGWRGSKPEYVLPDFIENYKAKVYMLSQNYRSTQALTAASFGYLCATYPDLVGKYCPKDVQVNSPEVGDKILCMAFDNRREEGAQIYRYLRKNIEQGVKSLCVIARSNFYLSMLARTFEECNKAYPAEEQLRFFTAEEDLQFYKKPIIKDVLAVLKLLLNPTDRISMERVTEKYVRLVGAKTVEWLRTQNPIGVSIVSFLEKHTFTHEDPYHVLIEGFLKGEIVVYDAETTGLDLHKDEMVQLAAIRINADGQVVDTFEKMIIPTVPIGDGAYATHGFNMDYITAHGGVTAKVALEEFSAFANGAVLVGHNSQRFDAPLLARQLKDNGLPPLDILGEFDTLTIAKQFHADLPNFKLSTLCGLYGIVNEAAHNAYGDIVATGKVLHRMLTEDVIPTAMERKNVCAKHKDKFQKLYAFIAELNERMKTEPPLAILTAVIDRLGMDGKCKTDGERRALSDLRAYFRAADGENAESFLRDFIERADLSGSRADLLIEREHRIPLLTVHNAKGCEFETVVIAGADDKNFPNFYTQGGKDEGEEKVFYVAITRAKKRLVLTRALWNGRERIDPSRFVAKIPEEYLWKNSRWDGEIE